MTLQTWCILLKASF